MGRYAAAAAVVAVLVAVLVAVGVAVFVRREGGGRDDSSSTRLSQPAVATPKSVTRANIDDPGLDGWTSEAFATLASDQLKKIGKLMAKPSRLDAAHLADLVAEDFTCGELRPENLDQVFRDDALTVSRPAGSHLATGAAHRGVSGLAEALRALVEGMEASQPRVAFKLFRVEAAEHATDTSAYFQVSGRSEAGTLQRNAAWSCRWRPSEGGGPPRLVSIEISNYEEVVAHTVRPLFADCTEGVLGSEAAYREQLRPGIDYWLASQRAQDGHARNSSYRGLAVGDANGDGLDDIYVCQDDGVPNRLFVQQPDGTARDVSRQAGVDFLENAAAALFVDIDDDDDQDLVVASPLGVLMLENDGAGRFAVRTAQRLPHTSPLGLAAADYDQDGDLDFYICCYRPRSWGGDPGKVPIPYHDANNGSRNVLLRNEGGWHFRQATRDAGLDENNRRWSFTASWEDYDNDGDLDLYVANDYGRNNLYQNEKGHFHDVAAEAGVEDISAGMSVAWGDYDNDGWMDLYVSNMFSSAGNRVTYQRRFQKNAAGDIRSHFQRHARGNSLFRNAGDGTFHDVSDSAAVTMGRWAWGSCFVDINNDGWKDLFVANGFATQTDPDDL
jgi:hypothetical protein